MEVRNQEFFKEFEATEGYKAASKRFREKQKESVATKAINFATKYTDAVFGD